jgi:hydrogenase maturation protease
MTEPVRRALVIGYGSPIRGDDALGPLAADRLDAEGVPEGVRVLSRHVLTAELAEDIAAADLVVFLDAATDGQPGEIRIHPLVPDATAISTMAHFLDPRELLAWAETLYDQRPQAWLASVAGARFDYGLYELSPAVASALGPLIERVRGLVGAERGNATVE